ncbi:MAG: SDR family NAD(P)-dependent oxidoreductase [Gammaproteobacteria bacterium]
MELARATMDFNGKSVWITGGASGIGLAAARRFAARGAYVTVFDLRISDQIRIDLDNARRFSAIPVRSFVLDVTDGERTARLFSLAAKEGGAPDLVLNSAGITSAGEFERLSYDEWDRVVRVNLYGSRNVASAALPLIKPGGRLALVAALAGVAGGYGYAAYAASKFGVVGLAQVLRLEWKPRGVGVSVICPAEVDTPAAREERKTRPVATSALKLLTGVMTVDDAADEIIDGLARDHYMIVPGRKGRVAYLVAKFLPLRFLHLLADRVVARANARKSEPARVEPATARKDGR